MEIKPIFLTVALSVGLRSFCWADVPFQINFQGRIELPAVELGADNQGKDDKQQSALMPFTGTGLFKFAIVSDSGTVLWTNVPASLVVPPSQSVSISVRDGIFNAALGDPALGMPPITSDAFGGPDRSLRVFFKAEIRDEKGRLRKTTSERELLPPQRLLTVPFAFVAAKARESEISKQSLVALLAGATIQGTFAVANALAISTSLVQSFTTFKVGHSWLTDTNNNPSGQWAVGPGAIATTVNPGPAFNFPGDAVGGSRLNIEAAGGLFMNQIATGSISLAAAGGTVLVSTPPGSGLVGIGVNPPLFKLHISSGAGEAGDILVVSTGASNLFRVNGQGEVRANKYFGDGSALTGIGGGASSVSTLNTPATTPFGGIEITSNVFIDQGNLAVRTTAQDGILNVRGGSGTGMSVDGFGTPSVLRLSNNRSVGPWTILFDDEDGTPPSSNPSQMALYAQYGFLYLGETAPSFNNTQVVALQLDGSTRRINLFGDLRVSGSKAFEQPDPTDPAKEILFYTLEGPEVGTYARGTARLSWGEVVVQLPSNFTKVTSSTAPITVQVTALDECNGLRVVRRSSTEFVVRELAGGHSAASFDWFANGVRAGYENAATSEPAVSQGGALSPPLRRGNRRK